MKSFLLLPIPQLFAIFCFAPFFAVAQTAATEPLIITKDSFSNNRSVATNGLKWKYRAGDDITWAAADFDDSNWDVIEGSNINRQLPPPSGWNGRGWFRLRFQVDESVSGNEIALQGTHYGASEVYLNGQLVTSFGEIKEQGEIEYNPAYIPVPVKFRAGENVLAIRYSASVLGNSDNLPGWWLKNGGVRPSFAFQFSNISDFKNTIQAYSDVAARRPTVFYIGVLMALGLLHLLMFLFYRVERANLFYSIHAFAFGFHLICINNFTFGHWGTVFNIILISANTLMLGTLFAALLAFLHVAFERRLGRVFWLILGIWAVAIALNIILLRRFSWLPFLPSLATFATFGFCIYLLVRALRQKRPGAWILMGGVLLFAGALMITLLRLTNVLTFPLEYYFFIEIFIVLSVPVAVSIFLARNFARTSRNLQERLEEVKRLSEQQIEHERHAAELRAENERRAKELEEARQLQLSMLPKKLPELPNLEIAAYMKPATEVGGDYYDFYVGNDGTLTAVIGDATGHGLKAGSVVTATKSLFNAFAEEKNIPQIFGQTNRALKRMNLRGLFMAMAMLKIRDNRVTMSVAGMPPMLIYRAATGEIEEIVIRALPLGSISNFAYQERELQLAPGDVLVLMSDGFPEMFNAEGEMLSDDEAKRVLAESAHLSAQEIINRFVKVGENWAGTRPPDDDVTFVVLKVK
ncbi:MAG: SpoIIE family protein phosphatase [Acidobacteriota bacterium]|nr:SpoIIE family protein phosphatase [Acidobacteriota bacterium]